jgi:serine/threonine-protein kinase
MGAVYQAWDAELGVAVALKIVRPGIASDARDARDLELRFKRELLLARKVTHKNVVRIHDMGEINGIKYITMPYVEGVELTAILRSNPNGLPIEQVMKVARGIVAGLAAAHGAGVVHRDLKPANIMVEDETGDALIMDFGIARSAAAGSVGTGGSAGDRLHENPITAGHTMAGSVVGTVDYMAPEQARGEEVDHRVDVYAVGLILYDMLTGRARSTGSRGAVEELKRRMEVPLPSVTEVRTDVPQPLERIIARCVSIDPKARYGTTTELAADLDRLDEQGRLRPVPKRFTKTFVAGAAAAPTREFLFE